jgi:serine/threonine protein phosphatase PrpC
LAIYNTEHGIPHEKKLDLSLIYPRKKDIFDFNIHNSIHSYSSISVIGSKQENQDDYFYYNNYFLIKNLTLFGVCDGHGHHGKEISNLISILFPSYLFYILLDDNLIERKLDINNKILKLMKIQEAPDEIKNMFIFRYFFNKFEIDFSFKE